MVDLQHQLQESIGKKLKLKINDNRSTMVSVRWEPDHTRVSLHRMFLEAPEHVMEEIVGYIKRRKKQFSPKVKAFIQDGLKGMNYSSRVRTENLITKGNLYDLEEVYRTVEKKYFKEPLGLKITWYGKRVGRRQSTLTLGQYHNSLKLIKVHRVLDSDRYPPHLIHFVVYHEMLHHICPPFVNERGHQIVHTPDFKRKERLFKEFAEVDAWMNKYQDRLFSIR